jgi:hypothetical protein
VADSDVVRERASYVRERTTRGTFGVPLLSTEVTRLFAEEDWMSGDTAIYSAIYAYNAASLVTSASDNSSAYAYSYKTAG